MFRPSAIQTILLTTAAKRTDGSLLPLPDSVASPNGHTRRSITRLINNGLLSETSVDDPAIVWREDDGAPLGVFITGAGREAIGFEPNVPEPTLAAVPTLAEPPAAPNTKAALVLGLLQRADGATIDELATATGWLPHTTRAALTGLRKKGHGIIKFKRDEATCYRIEAGAG